MSLAKKKFEELKLNSQIIVNTIDNLLVESICPTTIRDFDPTTEEMIEGIKYAIDTGWLSDGVYARKIEYLDEYKEMKLGVYITDDESDFKYAQFHKLCNILDSEPEVIGIVRRDKEKTNNLYDGIVRLKLSDGKIISPVEYQKTQEKQLVKQ